MNAKLTQDELQAIKERAEKATPGEWKADEHRVYSETVDDEYICEMWLSFEDAEFIAAARQDIPKLMAEVERLRKAIEFYADVKNFETFDSPAIKDSGHIAREALE